MMWRNMDELCCKNKNKSMYIPYDRHKIMVDQCKNEVKFFFIKQGGMPLEYRV